MSQRLAIVIGKLAGRENRQGSSQALELRLAQIEVDNPIQRAWRDVHAMRAHAGNNPERAAFVFSRSEFGLPPQDIRF